MRVRLLNDGGYTGMQDVEFPVEVGAAEYNGVVVNVPTDEIVRIGGDPEHFIDPSDPQWPFSLGHECEVITNV